MRSTLATAKASRIAQVLGICADSDEFISYINEAQQRLISRGHWKGSFQPIALCVSSGCITLPRQVAAISEVSVCNESVPIRNQWFEYLPGGIGTQFNESCSTSCQSKNFIDRGFYPTIADIIPGEKKIRVYSNAADNGKRIFFKGYDENNAWIRSLDGSSYVDGFYITLDAPFVDSTFDIRSVTHFQKEVTKFNVLVYEIATDDTQRLLGSYEPSETVAEYRRYFMTHFNGHSGCSCSSCSSKTIHAIAKLNFIPVELDTDYLYIDNIPALKEMCQAIRFGEMDSPQAIAQAKIHERNAIKELQHEQQTYWDNDTISIGMRVHGTADLRNKKIGRLM